jgi:hypothetical protein
VAGFECSKQNTFLSSQYLIYDRGFAFGSLRGKTLAISPADNAQKYIGFASHCLKVARSLPKREDRIIHREMATEWIRLAQMLTEDAVDDASRQVGNARIGTVS